MALSAYPNIQTSQTIIIWLTTEHSSSVSPLGSGPLSQLLQQWHEYLLDGHTHLLGEPESFNHIIWLAWGSLAGFLLLLEINMRPIIFRMLRHGPFLISFYSRRSSWPGLFFTESLSSAFLNYGSSSWAPISCSYLHLSNRMVCASLRHYIWVVTGLSLAPQQDWPEQETG